MFDNNHIYIIAEAGVNHNGRLDLALQLCDDAKNAGADAVKFQTWKTEKITTKNTIRAEYQIKNTDVEQSQFDMLKVLELSYDDFRIIKKHCEKIGIEFLSTPDEEDSLDFLLSLNLPFIKIGSGEITNIPYLRYIGSKKCPVVISTGMSYLGEVERAYNILKGAGVPEIAVLHCTTNYPCPFEEVNLSAMQTLKNALKCTVGYSDHTLGIEVSVAAVAMGAKIIEKHFTLDTSMEGPDHAASLAPEEFQLMVNSVRNIEKALGDGIKRPNASEKKISEVVLKKIVARKEIKKGELFSEDNICVKRNFSGIEATLWDHVIGIKSRSDFQIDQSITI